jgi:endoglucanase
MSNLVRIIALAAALLASPAMAQTGFYRADGTRIVDGEGRSVILRGMGLGGWMLQEGYMLQLSQLGQQHVIRGRLEDLVGPEATARFYEAWLDNYVTKADIDAMARWGFNSVRLPMHYDLLTLPVDQEPVPGRDTWHEDGFARIDALLDWVKANGMVLILDLHAAPGGQGSDLAISDRDPSKPSLWDSAENQRKTVALWRRLAERYADEPAIAAYDIINEPNWDFEKAGGGHGCEETTNAPLRKLSMEITAAIREVDPNHLVIIEGNCWGNNYRGVLPAWDGNLALSFHKYWNANDAASIAGITALRDEHGLPIWLGESGENSNVWFRDAIGLVEGEGAGWAFWPLKKIGFNQPLQVEPNPGWPALVAYLTGQGPRPDPAEAEATLMRLATQDVRFENNRVRTDVIDAMLRQPHDPSPRPFADHRLGREGGVMRAADYDLGPAGVAYADSHDADYKGPRERVWWNTGRVYRNDGVDIVLEDGAPVVVEFETGEWMRYTVVAEQAGTRAVAVDIEGDGALTLGVNGAAPVTLDAGAGWVTLLEGRNTLVLRAERCDGCRLSTIRFGPPQ